MKMPDRMRLCVSRALTGLALSLAVVPPIVPPIVGSGDSLWTPELASKGPVVIVVSLPEQLVHVYRNGVRIGVSTISTGRPGHETPTGVFTILEKRREHYSSLYDNAPMPFMQRLTWGGVALHAGPLPGYPASHGCIRLPDAFAEQLFAITGIGTTVVVADDRSNQRTVVHPGLFAPVEPATGTPRPLQDEVTGGPFTWSPERAPSGPVTAIASVADGRVVILRNGVEIGRARLEIRGEVPAGTWTYVLLAGLGEGQSRVVPGRRALRWQAVSIPGSGSGEPTLTFDQAAERLAVAPEFAQHVYDLLTPGDTVVVTDASVHPPAAAPIPDLLCADGGC